MFISFNVLFMSPFFSHVVQGNLQIPVYPRVVLNIKSSASVSTELVLHVCNSMLGLFVTLHTAPMYQNQLEEQLNLEF